ncbi:MAG: asparagine synthase (glutamine-hydrolyzing) [Bacteroidota bacterium]
MCGITGIFAFNEIGRLNMINLSNATQALSQRGPDFQNTYNDAHVGLGHRRLSVIDTGYVSNQPMQDDTGRYHIIYNGEIYNYKQLRKVLRQLGHGFNTESDTEVLLKSYIEFGESCLHKLNGFFAFCIYDKLENTFFIARDRFGIKPLCFYLDEDKFLFSSELNSLFKYGIEKQINYNALFEYFKLNYISAPQTIYEKVFKLKPGEQIKLKNNEVQVSTYYNLDNHNLKSYHSYDQAKDKVFDLVERSIQKRLVADVPLGTFLSGGIDSSIITGLASKYLDEVNSFSIGYKDEPFFDETKYARIVSDHFGTKHHVFSLTNDDLYSHLNDTLDSFDQPFADSSALPVKILSQLTRKQVTVALSGDGADEVFSGYNKHFGFYKSLNPKIDSKLIQSLLPLLKVFPSSRSGKLSNKIRQLVRYGSGLKLNLQERYYLWASLATEDEVRRLLSPTSIEKLELETIKAFEKQNLNFLQEHSGMNEILMTDIKLVLPNDMLTKVDLMSMSESLEVRVPFLDHELVEYVLSLPSEYKIDGRMKKKILQDAFQDFLPKELYKRPKHGFEVPLLNWFRRELKGKINNHYLDPDFVKEQGIFNPKSIENLKSLVFSKNPGDVHAQIWALIVFQHWWMKNFQ